MAVVDQTHAAHSPRIIRQVSVVVPMLNEREHIASFIESLAAQDFAGDLHLLVADGGSTDGSVARMVDRARAASLALTVVDDAAGSTSTALNRCIAAATGDLIVRMDCHSRYPADYIRRCVSAASETGAWNVGGLVAPCGRTSMERAVGAAMDSPFGGIGWTRHAGGTDRVEVDTVTFGAFHPQAFREAGLFDESLVRNQDDEFNLRLRLAGGRIVLDPSIRVLYTPRGSLRAVFAQYHDYGYWKVPVMLKHRKVLSGRSLAPLVLVLSAAGLAVLSPFWKPALVLLALEVTTYVASALGFAVKAARRNGDWRLLGRVASVFPAFHLGYGVGMLRGGLVAAWRWASARRRRESHGVGTTSR
jgi:succinoglycan biosynthesis protein ExoA